MLHPSAFNPDELIEPYDMAVHLVHELLHLHFASFMNDDENSLIHVAQEQAIEDIARALVKLKRDMRQKGIDDFVEMAGDIKGFLKEEAE